MADDPRAQESAKETPEQIKEGHKFLMDQLRSFGLLDDLRGTGITYGGKRRARPDAQVRRSAESD